MPNDWTNCKTCSLNKQRKKRDQGKDRAKKKLERVTNMIVDPNNLIWTRHNIEMETRKLFFRCLEFNLIVMIWNKENGWKVGGGKTIHKHLHTYAYVVMSCLMFSPSLPFCLLYNHYLFPVTKQTCPHFVVRSTKRGYNQCVCV